MKYLRRSIGLIGLLLFAVSVRAESVAPSNSQSRPQLSAAQKVLADGLARFAGLFSVERGGGGFSTTLEVVRATGVPKQLAAASLELAFQPPDRMRLGTVIGKEPFICARNGQEIWIWQPGKEFGIQGVTGVPRFATAPGKLDSTELAPLTLPLSAEQVALFPALCAVKLGGEEEINGEKCRVVKAVPLPEAFDAFKIARVTLTFWLRERDLLPLQIGYADGKSTDVVVALRDLRVGQSLPDTHWQIPAAPTAHVERVALSHLVNFFSAAISAFNTRIAPLGPATGEVSLIARHGDGRLEEHDGTKVLFLKGTPEQMGEQHGALLERQVRNLVQRVLYGVGVGSSFAKNRWFFGEIEACEARIARFVDPRALREMDALARAAGCEVEEIRLANFFPELFHCSGFALMGDATKNGRIFHGRILDYLKGIGLEQNATIIVHQPDQGHAWVNVGYAGFVGTVTAMNEKQISIGEMGGRGEGNWDGKPMAQLLREVMEKASTLEEAVKILQRAPRTCEYYYVVADGKSHSAVGIAATPDRFEVVRPGEGHPQLPTPVPNTVLLSAGDRYTELARRVQEGFGQFDETSARALMTRPVCMSSNIHSVLFAPDTLDFWVANADSNEVASHARYTHYNLRTLLLPPRDVASAATPPSK